MTTANYDYDAIRRDFAWPRPERYNFAREVIDRWADRDGSHKALLWTDDSGRLETRTFADIAEASRRTANVLRSGGVKRGDTVIVILGRQIAWWESVTACLRMGAVVSPGTTQLSAKDISYRINAAAATAVITEPAIAEKVDRVAGECPTLGLKVVVDGERDGWVSYEDAVASASSDFDTVDTAADEEALCYFTSGTTGYPKMTIHSHSYALGHETTGRYWLDLGPDDLHWNISDTGWAKAAWSSYFAPWLMGACLFVHHTSGFDPKATLEMFAKFPITVMCGAPTIYRMFVLQDLGQYTFPHLRHCVGAGEPLNPEVIAKWKRATGLTIRDGYGQTETVLLCGSFPFIPARPGSMGKPAPGIDLDVVDDDGKPVPVGEEGNIAVRVKPEPPQGLFKGYKGEPERTASCFVGDWYFTGDKATKDEDGYFWFKSRADDVILSSGYRIGPFEVESALIEHPAVAESAVVSSPDETRGEVVKAFVVLAPGYKPSDELVRELQEHVKTVTAPYKYPRKVEFLDSLPKTVSGKIRRVELRQKEWGKE
ncbi:MAG: acyl-CoA synthetase [Alphaproteobacteria bacterium]|nr:MAG: acyl-CoA synthetase [Alphaproteobacteria bacterium]